MDSSKIFETLSDLFSKHKLELTCVLAATAAYQIYEYQKNKETQVYEEPTKSFRMESRMKRIESSVAIPSSILNSENSLLDEVQHLYSPTCSITKVPHLILDLNLKEIPFIKSPLLNDKQNNEKGGHGFIPEKSFVYCHSYVLSKNYFHESEELVNPSTWLLAGPRKFIFFQPKNVKAAIVTCGGLCPGFNVVIRQIFTALTLYGCEDIWGVKYGYMGFYSGGKYWTKLEERFVRDLMSEGGTILGSSRDGFDAEKIINAVVSRGINQIYVIGGNGAHSGIGRLLEEIQKRKLQISIVGIPKTIDNDIPFIDKSFGFETAVSESIRAIRSAYVESIGVDLGIGLVRLMGRDAGFIAMQGTNGSKDVDICLVPEFQFDLLGPCGVLEYIYEQLMIKRHLVVVVAEGAGSGIRDIETYIKRYKEEGFKLKDKSGKWDVGVFLKQEIKNYFLKEKGLDIDRSLKYIDPTYMIRTVPANCYDRKMCADLASSAVHGTMAGFTGFTVGNINQHVAMIPISSLGQKPNCIEKQSQAWQRLLSYTDQPSFQNEESEGLA